VAVDYGINDFVDDDDDHRIIRYCGRVVVDRYLFLPYTPRKALDRKSFPVHDACTYVFDLLVNNTCNKNNKPNPLIESCVIDESAVLRHPAPSLVPVTRELIKTLRANLLRCKPKAVATKKKKT